MRTILGKIANHADGYHVAPTNLKPVMHLIEDRMGLPELVQGTLNICIPQHYIVIAHAVITPTEYGLPETVKLRRCLINGYKAIIMRPDTHEVGPSHGNYHGKNHLELMGRVKFREVLRLQDGDTVNIEVDGDDDWWESGH